MQDSNLESLKPGDLCIIVWDDPASNDGWWTHKSKGDHNPHHPFKYCDTHNLVCEVIQYTHNKTLDSEVYIPTLDTFLYLSSKNLERLQAT